MGTKWCVHATEDNMKTLIMCVIVLFAVSQAAPFASETDDFADNFAVEEYEFEQEAKTSLIDAGWKKAQYGDKQYKSGEKSLKAGTKIADTPRMGAFKNSMKKISKATHHFKEAKARYLTKKGCHRVKQCKTRHCSKKEMLLEKKKKALVQTSYYSHQQGQLHCKKNRWGSIDQRQCRYKHGKDKRHCEVDLQACNSLVYCEHNRDMCRSDCARCGRPSCSRYSSYSRGGSCTSICDRERESCDSTHKHHRDHQHWEINHYHRSTGGGCQRRYSWEPCRSVGSEMLLEKKKKKKSAKKGKKKKGKKKKAPKLSHKEVKAKHKAWNKKANKAHAKSVRKTNKLHRKHMRHIIKNGVKSYVHAKVHAIVHKFYGHIYGWLTKEWGKVGDHYRRAGHYLNKRARIYAHLHAASIRAQGKQLVKDRFANLKKLRAVARSEAKAMKKSAVFQGKMRNLRKKLSKASKKAKAAGAKKLAAYKAAQSKLKSQINKAKAQGNAIANAMKAAARKNAAQRKAINTKYKNQMSKLAAKNKKNMAAFNAKQKKYQAKMAAKAKGNKKAYAIVKAALARSEKRNKNAAKKLSASINRRYAKEKAAKKKADNRYKKSQKAAAAALKARRAHTAEKFAKKAARANRQYRASMREASVKKKKAQNAARREKGAKAASERNTKAQEKETKASSKKDMAMKECALDGSECQWSNGKCAKTTKKGPFMASDLVSCSKTKPSSDMDAGLSWAGISPPLALPPLPKPSAKCKGLRKKVSKYLTGNPSKDMVNLGCGKLGSRKKDLMNYFDMAAACPPICKKGTKTSNGRTQDPHGDCIDGDTMAMFKMQITSMPVYKKMGTNGRFKAKAGAGSICNMVKNLAAGLGF